MPDRKSLNPLDSEIDKARVAQRFGQRVASYDAVTPVQAAMGRRLLERSVAHFGARPGLRILELGCGTGRLTSMLAGSFPGAELLAVDISPEMVACARGRVPEARFMASDAEALVVELDQAFDLVISNAAVQWFQDCDRTLARARALLRPGGLLAVSTFGEQTFHELREAFDLAYAGLGKPARPHMVGMRPVARWRQIQPDAAVEDYCVQREFPDVRCFLRSVQEAGAVNSLGGAHHLGRDVLRAMTDHYRARFATPGGGVHATYHCVHLYRGAP